LKAFASMMDERINKDQQVREYQKWFKDMDENGDG
jgi:hypothetical protein